MNVVGFHIANNLMHAVNAVLIFLIVALLMGKNRSGGIDLGRKNTFPSLPPLIAGLAFGLHTLNTQAVNYISSRSVLLVTLFYLLSFYLYIRFRSSEEKPALILFYTLSVVCYALSLLSKEIGITLPVMLILYEFLTPAQPIQLGKELIPLTSRVATTGRIFLKYHIPFWGVSFIYLGIRKGLLRGSPVGISVQNLVEGTGAARGVYVNIMTQLKADVLYLKLYLLPTNLTLDKLFPEVTSLSEPGFLFALSIIIAILAYAIWVYKSIPLLSLGLVWFFIAITPVTILPLNLIYNEHRTYLPIVGLSIATGVLAQRAVSFQKYFIILFALFVALNGAGSIKRNRIWGNPVRLWSDVVKKNPFAYGALNTLGNSLAEEGDYDGAMEAYRRSMALAPTWERTYYNIGMTLSHRGVDEKKAEYLREAITYYEKALKLHPSSYRTYNSIAVNYYIMREYDKALEYINRGLERNPDFPYFYSNLGLILSEGFGKREEAIEAYRKALSFDPTWVFPRERLRELGVISLGPILDTAQHRRVQ
ncbi:MAG: tetratricopeptide repeat protein [Thermodesulfobacteriota bacterium]